MNSERVLEKKKGSLPPLVKSGEGAGPISLKHLLVEVLGKVTIPSPFTSSLLRERQTEAFIKEASQHDGSH